MTNNLLKKNNDFKITFVISLEFIYSWSKQVTLIYIYGQKNNTLYYPLILINLLITLHL